MLQVHCSGTPNEIGHTHGTLARTQVAGSIAFYASLFREIAKLDWAAVRTTALQFEPVIRRKWPAYLEEMRGIADGAGVELADVLALNVRTEIAFGLFTDGCTMLAWHTPNTAVIAQNWDWRPEQRPNLIALSITQPSLPSIRTITEAGILAKIGFNAAGVGCTLNAIRARGMDPTRMPCHLALRAVLEAPTKSAAVAAVEKHGVASSCTISVADEDGAVCLECSATDLVKVFAEGETGRVYHSNHFLVDHPGVIDTVWLPDSISRVARIRELSEQLAAGKKEEGLSVPEDVLGIFKDGQGFPRSINAQHVKQTDSETLFNVIFDLKARRAYVTEGRPTEPEGAFVMEL